MDVLAAILACSLHSDYDVVRAIAFSNARRNPYAVIDVDATGVAAEEPRTAIEAASRLEEIGAKKHRALLGLMVVPPEWAKAFGQPTHALFEPCVNVSVGTAMLERMDAGCRKVRGLEERRECSLARYEAAIGLPDFAAVVALQLEYLPRISARDAAASAPVFAPAASRAWGADRLFFSARGNELVFAPLVMPKAPPPPTTAVSPKPTRRGERRTTRPSAKQH